MHPIFWEINQALWESQKNGTKKVKKQLLLQTTAGHNRGSPQQTLYIIFLYVQKHAESIHKITVFLTKWKNPKVKKMLTMKPQKKTWHNSDPPNHFHRVWIILGKLDTKATHHTNRSPHYSVLKIILFICLTHIKLFSYCPPAKWGPLDFNKSATPSLTHFSSVFLAKSFLSSSQLLAIWGHAWTQIAYIYNIISILFYYIFHFLNYIYIVCVFLLCILYVISIYFIYIYILFFYIMYIIAILYNIYLI